MINLYNDDCLKIMATLPDASCDCIICDLPYGITDCKWDSIIPFDLLWEHYKRIIKPKRAICLFATGIFMAKLMISNEKWWKYNWIWDKTRGFGFHLAKYRPMQQHEEIAIFCSSTPTWFPQLEKREKPVKSTIRACEKSRSELTNGFNWKYKIAKPYTHKQPSSILTYKSNFTNPNRIHTTQKPVELLEYLIKTYTTEGETILDSCFGSCSTGVACVNLNRNFIGIEKDPDYFAKGKEWVEQVENERKQIIIGD